MRPRLRAAGWRGLSGCSEPALTSVGAHAAPRQADQREDQGALRGRGRRAGRAAGAGLGAGGGGGAFWPLPALTSLTPGGPLPQGAAVLVLPPAKHLTMAHVRQLDAAHERLTEALKAKARSDSAARSRSADPAREALRLQIEADKRCAPSAPARCSASLSSHARPPLQRARSSRPRHGRLRRRPPSRVWGQSGGAERANRGRPRPRAQPRRAGAARARRRRLAGPAGRERAQRQGAAGGLHRLLVWTLQDGASPPSPRESSRAPDTLWMATDCARVRGACGQALVHHLCEGGCGRVPGGGLRLRRLRQCAPATATATAASPGRAPPTHTPS